jgi:tRNA dimethylallyltransferase
VSAHPGESRGDQLPPLLVIGGPTATGKSALALAVAEAIPGTEIVGADSRQVYRGMDIGTAKATAAERARVPHHGLDVVEPDQPFTAADFRRHALAALKAMAGRAPLAVLVGGTGLYLRAIARGLPLDETGRDPQARTELETRLASAGLAALVEELQRVAPGLAATTDLANPRRVVRALERVQVAGDRPPPAPRPYPAPVAWLGLDAPAATHDEWIERRARSQFDDGLLEEAAALRSRYDPGLPAFSAFGYREAFAVLDGQSTVDGAVAEDALRTRRFARRQRTWFRAEPDMAWLPAGDPASTQRAIELGRRICG